MRQWRAKNPEKVRAIDRRSRVKNRAKRAACEAAWRKKNTTIANAYKKKWKKANPAQKSIERGMYRAACRKATPTWANRFFMAEIYNLAMLRSRLTGIAWEVDHVIPLNSKRVCGLHNEHNLRVVPAVVNRRKSNNFQEELL